MFDQALDLHKPLIFELSDGGQIALEIGMHDPGLAQALVVGGAYHRLEGTDYSFFKSGWLETLLATHVGNGNPKSLAQITPAGCSAVVDDAGL